MTASTHSGMEADGTLRFDNVSKTYPTNDGGLQAINNINLAIEPGTFASILGPSGCGKSTLLLLAAGVLPLTNGRITIGSETVSGPRTDIGFAFQQDLLLEWRTVLDNVLLQAELRGQPKRSIMQKALDLLSMVGLQGFEKSYPAELSGGMRQRVALVRALVMNLPILLLDEPFGALDAFTRDQLNADFQHLWWNLRPTVLFVTHSIGEAVFLGDQVIVMTPRPARIELVQQIDLPRPRRLAVRDSEQYGHYTEKLRHIFLKDGVLKEPEYNL